MLKSSGNHRFSHEIWGFPRNFCFKAIHNCSPAQLPAAIRRPRTVVPLDQGRAIGHAHVPHLPGPWIPWIFTDLEGENPPDLIMLIHSQYVMSTPD